MIDVLVLGKHKAAEGLVGTFSYATNVIWGQIAASVYLENGVSKRCLTRYAAVGFCVLAIGWCLSNKAILGSFLFFPLSPQIATPSFNLTAAGWAMLVFGALLLIIDHLKLSTWAKPFVVLGANPITVYVLVKLIDKWIYKTWTLSIGEQSYTFKAAAEYLVTSFAGLHYAQLGPVALKLITAWTIATVLWRNKLFIKL
jgi:predicted acyltransferase